jgi:hypothetical protein
MLMSEDDDPLPGETEAFDAQLERQIERLAGMSVRAPSDDPEEWADSGEDIDAALGGIDSLGRRRRFS